MNLTTTTTRQIVAVEQHGETCLASLKSFAECLNRAHRDFWSKPDSELQPFLQALLDDGKLQELFDDHEFYAASTNAMLERYDSPAICNTGALRAFSIEKGKVVMTPAPEPVVTFVPSPEPAPEPLPEPEAAPAETTTEDKTLWQKFTGLFTSSEP
jgi:hypothetical protein